MFATFGAIKHIVTNVAKRPWGLCGPPSGEYVRYSRMICLLPSGVILHLAVITHGARSVDLLIW